MSDRDSWCTPKGLADALYEEFGCFTYDPCSNGRSNVRAIVQLDGSPGKDGLAPRAYNQHDTFFVNPPYSRGQVVRWVNAFKHQRTCFLLRWDTSTAWWRELLGWSDLVWFPKDRINFEPPPGVTASSNPFPHALYFTFGMAPKFLVGTPLARLGTYFRPV